MFPNNNILSKEEVRISGKRRPHELRIFSSDEIRSNEALAKLKRKPNHQMEVAKDPFQIPGPKLRVDPSAYPFILEGQLASPEKIQMIGGLSEVPKIEETVTISVDGEEIRTVQFCRVPKHGFLKIINWAEFDTVLILFDGKERYGRIMIKGSDNKEKI